MNPTKLEKLLIDEVSGVDEGANNVRGWVVTKANAAAAATADELTGGTLADATSVSEERIATSIVGKLLARFSSAGAPAGKDDVEMTADELTTELDARFEALGKSLAEQLSTSLAAVAPASEGHASDNGSAPAPAASESVHALTVEDVAKALEEGLQPILEVIDKTLDRIAAVENVVTRKSRSSLEGQEGTPLDGEDKPTLKSAIGAALRGHAVELR